jgi:hypothetical protein
LQGKSWAPKFGYAPGKLFTLPDFEKYATEVKHGFFRDYITGSCDSNDDASKLVDVSVEHVRKFSSFPILLTFNSFAY